MTGASAAQRAIMRNLCLGFVFQSFNLLPRLTALDYVALPLIDLTPLQVLAAVEETDLGKLREGMPVEARGMLLPIR